MVMIIVAHAIIFNIIIIISIESINKYDTINSSYSILVKVFTGLVKEFEFINISILFLVKKNEISCYLTIKIHYLYIKSD